MIPAVIERCAGIDIGKKIIAVCVMTGASDQEPHSEIREFGTTTGELQHVSQWLEAHFYSGQRRAGEESQKDIRQTCCGTP